MRFLLPRFFLCPHINSVNRGMPVLFKFTRINLSFQVGCQLFATDAAATKQMRQYPVINYLGSLDSDTCEGTCVSGFLALLCDEIDRNAICPGNGRCCLTKKVSPQNKKPAKPIKCPGFCLPQSMSSLCSNPSNILHNTNSCNKGTVCCESKPASSNNNNNRTPAPKR